MPGGYPYHLFQCKEIQGHLSTELWNEVVEEVGADFSPDDVLLPATRTRSMSSTRHPG
jgi:hypothetical protein